MSTEISTPRKYAPPSTGTALALVFGGFFFLAVFCWWMDHSALHHGHVTLRDENVRLTSERDRLERLNGTLEASVTRLDTLAGATARSLDEANLGRARLVEQRDQQRRQIAELRDQLRNKGDEAVRVTRRAASLDTRVLKLTSAKGDLESRVQSLRDREQDLEARHVAARKTIEKLERRGKRLALRVEELETVLAKERAARDETVARLESVLEQRKRESANARREAQLVRAELEATQATVAERTGRLDAAVKQADDADRALAESRGRARALERSLDESEAARERSRARIAELERAMRLEKTDARKRVRLAEARAEKLASAHARLSNEATAARSELEASNAELTETRSVRAHELSALRKTSKTNDSLAVKSRDLAAKNGDLRRRLDARTAQVGALERLAATARRDREALVAEYVRSQDARRALTGKLEEAEKRHHVLERKLEKQSRRLEELEAERQRLAKKLEDVLRSIGRGKQE